MGLRTAQRTLSPSQAHTEKQVGTGDQLGLTLAKEGQTL